MRTILLAVFLSFIAVANAADKNQDSKLCSIRTVFIQGHGSTEKWFRNNLEKKTWLKIENVRPNADAIMEVGGVGSMAFPVNVRITRRDPEEFIWEGSAKQNAFVIHHALATDRVIDRLNAVANCPKNP